MKKDLRSVQILVIVLLIWQPINQNALANEDYYPDTADHVEMSCPAGQYYHNKWQTCLPRYQTSTTTNNVYSKYVLNEKLDISDHNCSVDSIKNNACWFTYKLTDLFIYCFEGYIRNYTHNLYSMDNNLTMVVKDEQNNERNYTLGNYRYLDISFKTIEVCQLPANRTNYQVVKIITSNSKLQQLIISLHGYEMARTNNETIFHIPLSNKFLSCERYITPAVNTKLLPDYSVQTRRAVHQLGDYLTLPDGSVTACMQPRPLLIKFLLSLTNIIRTKSIVFLLLTLCINYLSKKTTQYIALFQFHVLALAVAVTMNCIIAYAPDFKDPSILTLTRTIFCLAYISSYFWVQTMAIVIFVNFFNLSRKAVICSFVYKNLLWICHGYCWVVPLVIANIPFIAEKNMKNIERVWTINGPEGAYLNPEGARIFIHLPIIICVGSSFILYLAVIGKILLVSKQNWKLHRKLLMVYMKLLVCSGIFNVFYSISAHVTNQQTVYLLQLLTSFHGLSIFIIHITNAETIDWIRKHSWCITRS